MRTEVNYTEEVEDPVDSDGKDLLLFCLLFGRGMDLPTNTAVQTVTETLQEVVLKGSLVVLEQCHFFASYMWLWSMKLHNLGFLMAQGVSSATILR